MKVKDLLDSEEKWTQGSMASADRLKWSPVNARSPLAVCWCLVGAIDRCYRSASDIVRVKAACRTGLDLPEWIPLTNWNDDGARTFADVRELVTRLDI